jgi:hypothetical protein
MRCFHFRLKGEEQRKYYEAILEEEHRKYYEAILENNQNHNVELSWFITHINKTAVNKKVIKGILL